MVPKQIFKNKARVVTSPKKWIGIQLQSWVRFVRFWEKLRPDQFVLRYMYWPLSNWDSRLYGMMIFWTVSLISHSSIVYQLAPIYGWKPAKVIDDEMRIVEIKDIPVWHCNGQYCSIGYGDSSSGIQNYRSDKFEKIFSSQRFFQKLNKQIYLYCLSTCFPSYFGRKWRHQKDISKLTDVWKGFCTPKGSYWILRIGVIGKCQKVPKLDFQSQFFTSKTL